MMLARMRSAVRKEFRQFFRDPVLLILVLFLYTVEVVICATALNFELHDEVGAVLDLDRSASSRRLTDQLERSSSFRITAWASTDDEAANLLDRGVVRFVLVVPRGFGTRMANGGDGAVQLLIDGTNSLLAVTVLGQAQRLIMVSGHEHARSAAADLPIVDNRVRIWYNPDLRYVYSVVISMIALAAFMVAIIIPAASIVKEKERGTMEQLMVSPLRPLELLLAKTLPTVVIGLLSLGPSMLIARMFGVPFRGTPLQLALLSLVFLISAVAIGVLIATSVRTLQQALFVTFFVLFPVLFLSGTITPIESMPVTLQFVSLLSPLRHYVAGLFGVFLKGVGIAALWRETLWMIGIGALLYALAGVMLRRRLA